MCCRHDGEGACGVVAQCGSLLPWLHVRSDSPELSLQEFKNSLLWHSPPPPVWGVLPLARLRGQSPPAKDADVSLMVLRSNGVIFSTLRGLGGIQLCCWLDFLMDGDSKYLQKPKHVWNGEMLMDMIGRASPAHSSFSLPTCLLCYFCITPFLFHVSM